MNGCRWSPGMMTKKVTVPLDERVRARPCGVGDRWLAGYVSRGSEHEADSECLAGLVHGFMDGDDDRAGRADDEQSTVASLDLDFLSDNDIPADLEELLISLAGDPFRAKIAGVVSDAVDGASGVAGGRPAVRRSVMIRLREAGLNAGICNVKWDKSGGLTAGSYEYIDVLVERDGDHEQRRYVVDVDFAGEFEIARPTRQYDMILAALPRVLVSRPEELRQIVHSVSEAAKKSLKAKGLDLPPWRKNRYMQAKWSGLYRRTTDPIPAASPDSVAFNAAKHRPVLGFDFGKRRPAMLQALRRRRCCSQSCSLLSPAPPSDRSIGQWDPQGLCWRFGFEQLGDAIFMLSAVECLADVDGPNLGSGSNFLTWLGIRLGKSGCGDQLQRFPYCTEGFGGGQIRVL